MTIDHWLSILGLGGSVLFGLLSVYFYLRSRQLRRLDVLWSTAVIQTRKHPRVKILFDDREVETISRARFMLLNSGTTDIRRNDVAGGSQVQIQMKDADILSAACVGGAYEEVNATITNVTEDTVAVSFEYLNPGQDVVTELLITGKSKPAVVARIIGGTLRVRKWSTNEPLRSLLGLLFESAIVFGVASVTIVFRQVGSCMPCPPLPCSQEPFTHAISCKAAARRDTAF
jgi:hypothetical protein